MQRHQRNCNNNKLQPSLTNLAAAELEALKRRSKNNETPDCGIAFPNSCYKLLVSLPGNSCCIDCGASNPDWASISYGVLLCLRCSGQHRSYGVQKSFVRSISMDTWTPPQILAMLEGGNSQLETFFTRHQLGKNDQSSNNSLSKQRYHTKAALFYKINLKQHVDQVIASGEYKGRDAFRSTAASTASITETTYSSLTDNNQRSGTDDGNDTDHHTNTAYTNYDHGQTTTSAKTMVQERRPTLVLSS